MSDANPIQITSLTYRTVLNDINAIPELADKPDWWKQLIAGIRDTASLQINATANDNLLRTAFTRRAVFELVQLIDYTLSPQTTSSGGLCINLVDNVTFPVSISAQDIAALSTGSINASALRFEARIDVGFYGPVSTVFSVVDVGADTISSSGVFKTGSKVRLNLIGGGSVLPSPLLENTSYYLIVIDDTVSPTIMKLAATQDDAFNGVAIDITDSGTGLFELDWYFILHPAFQQETRNQYTLGTSDGTTEWQRFDLDDLNVILDSETVIINSITWTRVSTFVFSQPTDNHYRLLYNSDNSAYIEFGNGTYGAIPGAFPVFIDYAFGGGVNANISNINRINTYAGSSGDVDTIFNYTTFTGASGPENIEVAKRLAPLLLKARDRFITALDGETLALNFGGLSLAKINGLVYGLLSAQMIGIANGGGNPSALLRSQIQQHLIDRSILESIDIRFEEATITTIPVTCQIKILSGFSFTQVSQYASIAWRLFLSETGSEIRDDYVSNGVVSATTLVNSIFSTAFGESDYSQLEQYFLEFVNGAQAPRLFGEDIQESDAFAFVAGNTNGLDYMTISSPSSFPITLDADEITTPGVITITEIV